MPVFYYSCENHFFVLTFSHNLLKHGSSTMNRFSLWFMISRGYSLILSVIPYFLAVCLASARYDINFQYSFLGLLGVVLVQAAINMLDDYRDWTSGNVRAYKENVTIVENSRSHKCFYLEQNIISSKTLLFAIIFCCTIASLIGIYLAFMCGFIIIQIAMLGALLAISYSLPPFNLNSKGLGELAIGIIFGPLIVSGAYIVAGGNPFDGVNLISSFIVGILIANVAHTHSIMDYDADIKNNKNTLAVCLLNKHKAIFFQLLLYVWAYLFLILGIVYDILPIQSLLTLLIFPYAVELNELMMNEDTTQKLWMGPITRLKDDKDNYFMLRLCLSRNIVLFFSILLALTYYLYD